MTKIMNLSFFLMVVGLIFQIKCEKSLVSPNGNKKSRNVKYVSKRSVSQGGIVFCDIGCVLYDPKHSPLIDDPGRNFYDSFSVISTSYVTEVVGGNYGLSGKTLRVMFSDRVLHRRPWRTSAGLKTPGDIQETLVLRKAELTQRITFNLQTSVTVDVDSGSSEELTVKIPQVVPHVVFMHDFRLDHSGERVTGVVTVEACNPPMTLEVVVGRLEDGSCWVKPLDRTPFQDYMTALRVRSNNRHVIGGIADSVQTHLESYFPFEAYMDEVNEFADRFVQEMLAQTKNVIRKSKVLTKFCNTISTGPETSTTLRPPDLVESKLPFHIIIEYRRKNHIRKE